jgi:glucose uptake protein GlcU
MCAVSLLLGIVIVTSLLVSVAGVAAPYFALWHVGRAESRRARSYPPERRKRGVLGGAGALFWIAVLAAVLIVRPWGTTRSPTLVGSGALIFVVVGMIALGAVRDARAARCRIVQRPSPS